MRGENEGKEEAKGDDSGGRSVTLEEIRRLSSPLMTVEIVFLEWGGGNARAQQFVLCSFESFLCQVQVACLPPPPGSGPLSPSHKRQRSVG